MKRWITAVLAAALLLGAIPENTLAGETAVLLTGDGKPVSVTNDPAEAAQAVDKNWEAEDYFQEIRIRTDSGKAQKDGGSVTLTEVSAHLRESCLFPQKKVSSRNSAAWIRKLKKTGLYEIRQKKNTVSIRSPFQLKRVIVHTGKESLENTYGAAEVCYYAKSGDFILQYRSLRQTKTAWEKLQKVFGKNRVGVDQLVSVLDDDTGPAAGSGDNTAPAQEPSSADAQAGYVSWGTHFMGLDTVRNAANQNTALTGTVRVAVLDTGAYQSHEMLQGRIDGANSRNFLNCWYSGKKSTGNWADDSLIKGSLGHGTHVSGILADGTSKQVKLLELKVVDENGNGSLYDIGLAIQYAIKKKAKVINISAGVPLYAWYRKNPQYRYLQPILKKAYKKGILISCAAGNDGRDLHAIRTYPASSSYVTAVGAISRNKKAARFSNYGKALDFVAPGVDIRSANRFSKTDYYVADGTSMASPHIAAAAAMIYLYNPGCSAADVRKILRRCSGSGEKGKKKSHYGYGYVRLTSVQKLLRE